MENKALYNDAPAYSAKFFDLIPTDDLFAEFEKSTALTVEVFSSVSPEMENYAYAPNKWTVKEVLRHIIDMERIFQYRAFRFSRFDDTELSSVDEDHYIEKVNLADIPLAELLDEYLALRNSSIWIYRNCTADMLDFRGVANKQTFTARTLGFSMIGHNIHHCCVVRTRYLSEKV